MRLTPRLAALHRSWVAWLALCVALVMALTPTLSHALAWSQSSSGNFVEICTATGPRLVAAETAPFSADSPTGQESALSLLHCPFCLHTADRVAPPPHTVACIFLDSCGERGTTIWQAVFLFTHFALVPPPRGPPAAS